MGQFIWREHTEGVTHNFKREEILSTEEAQVLATLKLAETAEEIASHLQEFIRFLQTQSISVDTKNID